MGKSTDDSTLWSEKLSEVYDLLFDYLPFQSATRLYDLYLKHVKVRRGVATGLAEDNIYRKVVELEEALLQWEESKVKAKRSIH